MFVSDFYSFPRVQEAFGQLAKVKDEFKMLSTEKGEIFMLPFYMTKPSLLTITNETAEINWRGRLPRDIPSSFIGLFCSFQHFVRVKIIWKSLETGEIASREEEVVFKVIGLHARNVLGILNDAQIIVKDLDTIFPDDFILDSSSKVDDLLREIRQIQEGSLNNDKFPVEEFLRSIVEGDTGYNRSLSVEIDKKSSTIASIHLKKTKIHPGSQIFLTINLLKRVEMIKLVLNCVETYPTEYLNPMINEKSWQDTVKVIKLSPGLQDRLDLIIPVPPDLPATSSSQFYSFRWELLINFSVGGRDFDLKVPIEFYRLNYNFNKM